ncbi:MAG: hypothetical protein WCD76_05085 [Pyrinomonadaceae bacterium]
MTDIKILIYTDTKDISLAPDDPAQPATWSVSILRDILEAPVSPFLKFFVEVVNRYENPPQPRRIDDALLAPYDQVWIFGKYQNKVDGPFDEKKFGGPDNELDESEVGALEKWMTTHGVLIAGDHSDAPPPPLPPTQPLVLIKDFLCLGRALGHKVPRAGELRKWIGPPTSLADSSFNTLIQQSRKNPDSQKDDPDSDAVPQQYLLEPFGPSRMPHPLLTGKDQDDNDTHLDLFPDHVHEGEVIVPRQLGSDWAPDAVPSKQKPRPVVIARGCDKRHCRSRAVLAVYDPPEAVKAGRIVADSTWHHYLNINIRGLRDSSDKSAFLLLQQYYRHVAFFLAPLEKRQEVTGVMLDWMLQHPEVWEDKGNEPTVVGKVALKYLSGVATRYEIAEMLQHVILSMATTDADAADVRGISFPQMSAGVTPLPARELVVGYIVKSHYEEVSPRLQSDGENVADASDIVDATRPDARAAAASGVEMAFRSHEKHLAQIGSVTRKFLKILK